MVEREIASRVPMTPRDTEGLGYIFGGVILSHIDLAGATVARNACSTNVHRLVTRAMDKIEFRHPVLVNDVLSCYGEVTRIGRTSVTVHVDVEVDRKGEIIKVTEADLVFVAIDKDGNPTPVGCTAPQSSKTRPPIKDETPTQPLGPRILGARKVMMPNETNGMGNIFGGVLLSFMDIAGAYVAHRSCGNRFIDRVVTRFMDKVEFKQPVHVNDLLSCYGTITQIGTTSISVHVEVEANRRGVIIPVTAADIVYVALDKKGRPSPVLCSPNRGSGWLFSWLLEQVRKLGR